MSDDVGAAGLDQYQVRTYRAWHAHATLSMLALAWLAGTKTEAIKGESGTTISMIGYKAPKIRRLLVHLILPTRAPRRARWSWSHWRRRRQHHSRACHYRTRGHIP